MMCCQPIMISKPNLFGALLSLWFGAVLTSAGVRVLPIYLLVAAPCYFISAVLLLSLWMSGDEQRINTEKVNENGWF